MKNPEINKILNEIRNYQSRIEAAEIPGHLINDIMAELNVIESLLEKWNELSRRK